MPHSGAHARGVATPAGRLAEGSPRIATCELHPGTETELRCSRCDKYICPQCLVYTPVGVRCEECAMLRRPPMYELESGHYLRAVAVALPLGVAFGLLAAVLMPPDTRTHLFSLAAALIAGAVGGSALAGLITRVTGGKRGLPMQVIAIAGLGLAGAVRLFVSGEPELVTTDTPGALALVVGAIVAWGRLR